MHKLISLTKYFLPFMLACTLSACGGNNGENGSIDAIVNAANSNWPATTAVAKPPPLPEEFQALLDLPAPVLDSVVFDVLAQGTDPIAFGLTFDELGDSEIVEFQLASMAAQMNDGSRNEHVYHWYGHPDFNDQVAVVPVNFPNSEGFQLYGEIVLPNRGLTPPGQGPYPVIIALQGLNTNLAMYRWWHMTMADAGYLVFAIDFTGQGHSEGTDDDRDRLRVNDASTALTWLLESSPVKNFIDANKVGVIGHSLGAITTLEVQAVDDRFIAAVAAAPIHEQASSFDTADIPIMIQTGDHDGPVAPVPFLNPQLTRSVYDKLEVDRAFIVAEAASHAQHTNYPLLPTPTWSREIAAIYSVAWMDLYLKGDRTALERLLTPHDHLSPLHSSEVEIDGVRTVLRAGVDG